MARCNCCSAPLPPNQNRCVYCHVRNDVDLHSKHPFQVSNDQSDRICPHCVKAMQTVQLDSKAAFSIERCPSCYGLFFDPGEIEQFLQSSVSNVFDINLNLLESINQDRYKKQQVKYIKCPVCLTLMNRVNYAHRSGVIIDQCLKHGIWLDSGEITHLMEWKKAGGVLLHQKTQAQKKPRKTKPDGPLPYNPPPYSESSSSLEVDLIETVSSLIFKLFE